MKGDRTGLRAAPAPESAAPLWRGDARRDRPTTLEVSKRRSRMSLAAQYHANLWRYGVA